MTTADEEVVVAGNPSRARRSLTRARAWIHQRRHVRRVYRALVAVVGALIVVVGLILVPLPGPGWLIVFIGIATLGTEFAWAHRLGAWVRAKLAAFWAWWRARR